AENQLTGALGRMFALAESYPDLKANQNMMQLSEELTSTENKVAFARQAYNDAVMSYNNQREMFPGSVIAGMFNFTPEQLLEISKPEAREAPRVSFAYAARSWAWTSAPAGKPRVVRRAGCCSPSSCRSHWWYWPSTRSS